MLFGLEKEKKYRTNAQNGLRKKINDFLGFFFFEQCLKVKIKMAASRGLYKNPDKIGLAEQEKNLHRDPFCQTYLLGGFQGSLLTSECLNIT